MEALDCIYVSSNFILMDYRLQPFTLLYFQKWVPTAQWTAIRSLRFIWRFFLNDGNYSYEPFRAEEHQPWLHSSDVLASLTGLQDLRVDVHSNGLSASYLGEHAQELIWDPLESHNWPGVFKLTLMLYSRDSKKYCEKQVEYTVSTSGKVMGTLEWAGSALRKKHDQFHDFLCAKKDQIPEVF